MMHKTLEYHQIIINKSTIATVKEGRIYSTVKNGIHLFVFDDNGNKTLINSRKVKWKQLDPVVLIIKITSSRIDSIQKNKIYRVFDDTKNDERYIIDENGTKVLFDKTIFNYEQI